jgi:hypothetical protein
MTESPSLAFLVGVSYGNLGAAEWLHAMPRLAALYDIHGNLLALEAVIVEIRVRASGYLQAEEFASRSILQPPSEAAMLDAFSRVELRTEQPKRRATAVTL